MSGTFARHDSLPSDARTRLASRWPRVPAVRAERTLLGDGCVNWLPVHDPSGQYIAYLKSVGYTDLRLATKAGRDIGRLVPDLTQIRYYDWK